MATIKFSKEKANARVRRSLVRNTIMFMKDFIFVEADDNKLFVRENEGDWKNVTFDELDEWQCGDPEKIVDVVVFNNAGEGYSVDDVESIYADDGLLVVENEECVLSNLDIRKDIEKERARLVKKSKGLVKLLEV